MANRGRLVIPMILLLGFMCVLIYMAITRPTDVVQDSNNKEYDVVMALDFSENYPESPDKVLEAYNQIDRFLSGNISTGFSDADMKALIEKQRYLLDSELLAKNTLEDQIKGYNEKIDYLNSLGVRIMQINGETPVFSSDAQRCTIAVKQYWTKHLNIDLVYYLRKEEHTGKWKIYGWHENEVPQETPEG